MAGDTTFTAAEDLLSALSTFVDTISQSVSAYEQQALDPNSFSYKQWKETAYPLLEKDRLILSNALSNSENQNISSIKQVASNEVALSKNLDTFDLGFAGDAWRKKLEEGVTRVVLSASRVLHGT